MTYFLFIVIYLIGMSFTTALLNYLFKDKTETQRIFNFIISLLLWYIVIIGFLICITFIAIFLLIKGLIQLFENLLNKL